MISDQGGGGIPWSVYGTLLGTSTIIQCYPLVRAFLYPPPDDARGCQRAPARCPRTDTVHLQSLFVRYHKLEIRKSMRGIFLDKLDYIIHNIQYPQLCHSHLGYITSHDG